MKKRMLAAMFILLWGGCPALADQTEKALAEIASLQVAANARAMIQAGVDNVDVVKIAQFQDRFGFGERDVLAVQSLILEARNQGLPVEPIIDKAYEGITKKVPPTHILTAMKRVRARYAFAHSQVATLSLPGHQMQTMTNIVAEGLAAGLDDKALLQILQQLRQRLDTISLPEAPELVTETLYAARDMARVGVSSTAIAEALSAAHNQRYRSADINRIRQAFTHPSQTRQPDALARQYSQAIRQGKSPESVGSSRGSGFGRGAGAADIGGSDGDGDAGGSGGGGDAGGSGGGGGAGGSGGGGGAGGSGGGGDAGGSGGGGDAGGSGGGGDAGGSGGGGDAGGSGGGGDAGGSGGGGDAGGSGGGGDAGGSGGGGDAGGSGGGGDAGGSDGGGDAGGSGGGGDAGGSGGGGDAGGSGGGGDAGGSGGGGDAGGSDGNGGAGGSSGGSGSGDGRR